MKVVEIFYFFIIIYGFELLWQARDLLENIVFDIIPNSNPYPTFCIIIIILFLV
jgi:hypothetical protein